MSIDETSAMTPVVDCVALSSDCCYCSPDMLGHPELVTEADRAVLGPLISSEGLEQLQSKYVQSVRVRGNAENGSPHNSVR